MTSKNIYTLVPLPIRKIQRIITLTIVAFASLLFSSCEFWNEPVRGYFEKWTQEVSIAKYELVGIESYTDKDGNTCISSDQDAPVTLFMINPYHYSNVTVSSGDITTDATGTFPSITQDANDTTLLRFTYGRDFLLANECGGEIGATISLKHPYNGTENVYTFSIKSNSKPPLIEDAAIMTTGTGNAQEFVLAFRCPPLNDCKENGGVHHDIVSITIDGETYPVTPASNGELIFSDPHFTRTRPTPLNAINRNFDDSELAVYFCQNEGTSDETRNGKTYTITFTDSAGFTNSRTIDARLPGMSSPLVYDNDNAVSEAATLDETAVNILHIDNTQDAACSTVTIKLPSVNDIGLSLEGKSPQIYWELKDSSGNLVSQDSSVTSPSSSNVSLKIPTEGEYTLKVYATADAHTPSSEKTYRLKLEYAQLPPPLVKNTSDSSLTAGTGASTNNYVQVGEEGKATVKVTVPNADINGENFLNEGNVTVYYNLTQGSTGTDPTNSTNTTTSEKPLSTLTSGQWVITAVAKKPGYRDSAVATYKVRAYDTNIYVKSSSAQDYPGNDTTGDGTQAHPYATIERCIQEIQVINKSTAEYTIHIIETLTGAQTIDGGYLNDNAAKLTIKGEGSTGILSGNSSAVPLSITTTVPVFITDLKITGGSGDYGGGLYCKADVTLQNGVEISGNNATYSGGGIYLKTGSLTIENGVKIQNNSAKNGGGIVIDPDSTTVTIKGGTISENTATNGYGSGIYALKTFTVTEDAKIDSSNDVYLGSDKYINIDGTLNNNSVATITKGSQTDSNQWRRGTKVLTGDVPTTPSQKFTVAKTGWYVRNYSDDGYLDAPIFISGSGNNSANTGATADDAYKTLDAAALLCWNSDIDFTIKVVGEVQWSHTIKDDLNGKAKSLTLEGTDDGGTLKMYSNKPVLTVNTSVPVIIKNLTITGGTYKEGAGISIASGGTVKLGDGATVTGNTATASVGSEAKGGGVYVSSGAKLFMYGKALIGDKSKTDYATSGDYANKAVTTGGGTSYGGGIYNEGTVYLGYDAAGSQKSIDDGYGVRYNYAYLGGGIYNSGTVYLNTGNISYNQASANGGGIDNNSGTVSISGGTIKGNHAINAGGVLHLGGTFGISGGSLESNSASSHGGAIYAKSAFTLSGSPNISSNGTRNSNDVFFDTTSGNFSVSVSGNLGGSGNIYLDGLTSGDYKFYKHGYTALTGSITADNCNKFKMIDTWWKIGSDGKVKLNRDISVTYNINISDSKAAPAASSFTFTKSGTTITNPDSIHANKFGTTDAKPAQPSSDYYIGTDDKIYKFKGWENAAGTVSIGSSVTKLPESLLTGLVSPSVTLKAQWEEVTDNDEKNAAWSTFVYDENFYNNHNTFNVYTINQAKQIFDCNTTGSLCKAGGGKDFKDKIIKICSDINIGSIQTSAKAEIDGFAAQINFRGELNGNGKTITADITGNIKVGLIAVLNDGNIHDLKLAGTVTAGQNNCDTGGIVGTISGYPGGGTINYCTVSATIKDTLTNNVSASVGGIAGSMVTGTVKNCTVTSSTVIKGKFVVGGIVGWYSDTQDAVKNNTYEGKIYHNGTSGHTGKIIGKGSLSNTSNTASNGTISKDNAVTLNTSGY